jgi:hypothetical protein
METDKEHKHIGNKSKLLFQCSIIYSDFDLDTIEILLLFILLWLLKSGILKTELILC